MPSRFESVMPTRGWAWDERGHVPASQLPRVASSAKSPVANGHPPLMQVNIPTAATPP
jgi:hypothetical protein